MTSFKGLRIHQGKMKCGRNPEQHDRTASAGQTEEAQSQVENHSAAGPSNVERAASVDAGEEMEMAAPERDVQAAAPRVAQTESLRKHPERRRKLKWPKAKDQEEWQKLDDHLKAVLEHSL